MNAKRKECPVGGLCFGPDYDKIKKQNKKARGLVATMKYGDNSERLTQDVGDRVDDACVEAADELLYKLAALKRERTTLVNMASQRLRANLPLNSSEILSQAEKINRLLEDDAIAELFRFLRTSAWAQARLDEQIFKQPSLVVQSLRRYDAQCLAAADEEYQALRAAPIGQWIRIKQ